MFWRNDKIRRKGLVWKLSSDASNQVIQQIRWYNKRILRRDYSVPQIFHGLKIEILAILGSLEGNSPPQIYRADLNSIFPFLLTFVAIYSLSKSNMYVFILVFSDPILFSLFLSFLFYVFLSLSSTFYFSPLSFFAYLLLSLSPSISFFVCLLLSFLQPYIFLLWLSIFIN